MYSQFFKLCFKSLRRKCNIVYKLANRHIPWKIETSGGRPTAVLKWKISSAEVIFPTHSFPVNRAKRGCTLTYEALYLLDARRSRANSYLAHTTLSRQTARDTSLMPSVSQAMLSHLPCHPCLSYPWDKKIIITQAQNFLFDIVFKKRNSPYYQTTKLAWTTWK